VEGCCGLNVKAQPALTNKGQPFIAFADSCHTARPDTTTSLGKTVVLTPDGGAAAYLGYTRWGVIGIDAVYQQSFWCVLRSTGRLGPATSIRVFPDEISSIWVTCSQMLLGDPAMRVWRRVPMTIRVRHDARLRRDRSLRVVVAAGVQPLAAARVTVRGGGFFDSRKTSSDGSVVFAVPPRIDTNLLEVTVDSPDARRYRGVVHV